MSRLNMARKIRENHQNNNNSKELDNDVQTKQKKMASNILLQEWLIHSGKKIIII